MYYDRVSIKQRAREQLRQYQGVSIGVYVLYTVLLAIIAAVSFGLGDFFLGPPLLIGFTMFYMDVWRGRNPPFETLFWGFRQYAQALVAMLWMYLFTLLWSLLFIIPGIIKGLAYSMTPYLVADYPDLDARKALKISMAITKGRLPEIFVMGLSFLGWLILSGLTFGILQFVYVGPYMQVSFAGLYESFMADAFERRVITEADLH